MFDKETSNCTFSSIAFVKHEMDSSPALANHEMNAEFSCCLPKFANSHVQPAHGLLVKQSWISGNFQGLFASERISEGQEICQYRGKRLNTVQAINLADKSYLMRISSQLYIDASESTCCLAR
jgi:hypothetical protein